MEVKERQYLTEGEHATNDTLKADMLTPFLFFFLAVVLTNAIVSRN